MNIDKKAAAVLKSGLAEIVSEIRQMAIQAMAAEVKRSQERSVASPSTTAKPEPDSVSAGALASESQGDGAKADQQPIVTKAVMGGGDGLEEIGLKFKTQISARDVAIFGLGLHRLAEAATDYIETGGECEGELFPRTDKEVSFDEHLGHVRNVHDRAQQLAVVTAKVHREAIAHDVEGFIQEKTTEFIKACREFRELHK
jgi:hypothetical protein